jgi:hypothetical protein
MSYPFQDIHNKLPPSSHSKANSTSSIGTEIYSVSLEKMFSQ